MGAHLPATAANMSNMKLSDKTFTYSITKGAILDVSLTGGWVAAMDAAAVAAAPLQLPVAAGCCLLDAAARWHCARRLRCCPGRYCHSLPLGAVAACAAHCSLASLLLCLPQA